MNLRFKFTCIGVLSFILVTAAVANSQSGLPTYWEKCVVVIEKQVELENGTIGFASHGTGFFIADTAQQRVFLVTNRHILKGRSLVFIRVARVDYDPNKHSTRYFRHRCELIGPDGLNLWKGHPDSNVDVAALELQLPSEKPDTRELVYSRFKDFDSLAVGEDVYFFGFPFSVHGLEGGEDIPVLRSGVVSFKAFEPTYIARTKIDSGVFLVDGFSFGGNSGSPVMTRATRDAKASLVGIVYGHVSNIYEIPIPREPYTKVLTTGDTITIQLPPDIVIENAGLVKVISAGMILETLEQFGIGE